MRFLAVILLFCSFITAQSRDILLDSYRPVRHRVGASVEGGYLFSSFFEEIDGMTHIERDEKVNGYTSLRLNYGLQFTDSTVRNYFPGGYQGIGVGVNPFGVPGKKWKESSEKIGVPVLTYIYQGGPFIRFNKNVSACYEWQFGASFGWKPYSIDNNDFNLIVGSRVNAYINIGFFLEWKIKERLNFQAGLSFTHFSNGNTSWPNPGVNSIGLRLGVTYDLNKTLTPVAPLAHNIEEKRKLSYDIVAWGAPRRRVYKGGEKPVLLKGMFACAGLGFSPMVKFGNWVKVGGSADLQWDESSDLKKNYVEGSTTEDIKFTRPSVFRQLSFGISAHGELCMPIFSVNVGVGYNLVAPAENRGSYQNITLKTYFTKNVYLNVGYQFRNFSQQSSLMLGMGVTI